MMRHKLFFKPHLHSESENLCYLYIESIFFLTIKKSLNNN